MIDCHRLIRPGFIQGSANAMCEKKTRADWNGHGVESSHQYFGANFQHGVKSEVNCAQTSRSHFD